MKFRKIPVIIEAEQYTEYGKLVKGMCNSRSCFAASNRNPHVHTIHKGQTVDLEIGDWIIPEIDGEHFYPCKPDIFKTTYEEIVKTSKIGNFSCGCGYLHLDVYPGFRCKCGSVYEE